ncbi:MAG: HAD-IG family 5'-nucleotidase [Sandaracinus sp.]
MIFDDASLPPPARRIYCNRTLNLRSIEAIGFDMDYTLVHYHVDRWEQRAYEHARARLGAAGIPVDGLVFDPELAAIGLIVDTELGNLVKANRFGYVKRACHGTAMLEFEAQRAAYERVVVDLSDNKRWVFANTLFSLSEACLYMQLVDLFDGGKLEGTALKGASYAKLYAEVRRALDASHLEGELKAEIAKDPDRYVVLDPELPLALMDLQAAGKKLCVITNSEWSYTQAMMSHVFDRFLDGRGWRSLFELVIVGARKPAFFTERMPAFDVIDEEGRLLPRTGRLEPKRVYLGGHARLVEESLGLRGEDILYIGDHIFADVNISKSINRWRTCLVLRELERELEALEGFKAAQRELTLLMDEKELLEHRYSLMRLAVQRADKAYGPRTPGLDIGRLRADMRELRAQLVSLDERIAPLARTSGELGNRRWGLILRTGNDKSHLARQIERHADVYTSRVSNLLASTPFVYLRSPRGSLPHDSGPEGGVG